MTACVCVCACVRACVRVCVCVCMCVRETEHKQIWRENLTLAAVVVCAVALQTDRQTDRQLFIGQLAAVVAGLAH